MRLLSLSGRREASPLTFGHPTVRSLIRAVSLCGMGLRSVHSHLNLPTKLPIQLSFADQVRFVAETIRRRAKDMEAGDCEKNRRASFSLLVKREKP